MLRIKSASCATRKIEPEDTDDVFEKNAVLIIRGAIVISGIAGAVILARSLRLFTKFEHARQIPDEFFRRHVQLRGNVAYVTEDGRLRVVHSPIFRPISSWIFRRKELSTIDKDSGKLSLSIAGVEITDSGKAWLRQQILGRPIGFSLIRRLSDDDIQAEIVAKKGRWRMFNVNRELIRRGLGRVPTLDDYTHDLALKTNAEYARLINELVVSEKYADRRGVGIWRRRTALESLLSYPSQIKDRLENTSLYGLFVLLGAGIKQTTSLGYDASRSLSRMLRSAIDEYRRLSSKSS